MVNSCIISTPRLFTVSLLGLPLDDARFHGICGGARCPRIQRNQARLLHPAASADAELRAALERGPTDPLPMVRYDPGAGGRSLDMMCCGLVLLWAKDIKVRFAKG